MNELYIHACIIVLINYNIIGAFILYIISNLNHGIINLECETVYENNNNKSGILI